MTQCERETLYRDFVCVEDGEEDEDEDRERERAGYPWWYEL